MLKKVFLGSLVVLASMPLLLAQDKGATQEKESGITVELAGLQVTHQTYGDGFNGLRPLNQKKGTKVAFFVKTPGGLVDFQHKASTLTSFTDDKGHSLIVKPGSFMEGFGHFPKISKDGKIALFTIEGGEAPSKGASHILVKGEIVFASGSTKKTVTSEKITFKNDAVIKLGSITFTVAKFGKPKWGSAALALSLETNRFVPEVAAYRFKTADGKVFEHKPNGQSTSSSGSSVSVSKFFKFDKKIEEGFLEIDIYTDLKTHKMPLNMKISLSQASAEK
jgi:hypothetical protein